MSRIAESILELARSIPEGGLLSPKEFLHLGSRAAVDKTLSRLAQTGQLLRISRGVYVAPYHGQFGTRPPSTEAVIKSIEASGGESIVASGATEANALGLTTQVPTREVFFTSGSSRQLQLGNRCIELKHANRLQLLLGNRPAGMVIRALDWLGPQATPSVIKLIQTKIPKSEWDALLKTRANLPDWMAKVVSQT